LRHAKSAAWGEARLPEHDSFEAWANVLLTFGFVTFFSWAFPLAPMFAWLRTLASLRITAVNLSYNSRRPIARKASGIGVWFNILQIMSMLALLTNCAHMALASSVWVDYFPHLSSAERMLVVFLLEHVVLALRVLIGHLRPNTPDQVKTKISQDNYFLSQLNKAAPAGRRLSMF
jgi:anoctamin-8